MQGMIGAGKPGAQDLQAEACAREPPEAGAAETVGVNGMAAGTQGQGPAGFDQWASQAREFLVSPETCVPGGTRRRKRRRITDNGPEALTILRQAFENFESIPLACVKTVENARGFGAFAREFKGPGRAIDGQSLACATGKGREGKPADM